MSALTREQVVHLLDTDPAYFSRNCVKIVGRGGQTVPLVPKRAQQVYFDKIREQQERGLPQRFIILKARKLGFSTATEAVVVQRVTRRPNHHALIVGQDNDTASELFAMAYFMYTHLPPELQPKVGNFNKGQGRGYLYLGEPARNTHRVGLNSSLRVTNAKEAAKGRGFTLRTTHLTEVAHWPSDEVMVAVLNAVPEEPDTLVVLESTANGTNWFKTRWEEACAGESSYIPIFAPWHEEPAYAMALDAEQEERFWSEDYGKGEWGEDEERLVEQYGCTAGQLMWRRRAIVDRCGSKIDVWNQEYPASPADAFIASGKHVFAVSFIKRVMDATEHTDPLGERGVLRTAATRLKLVGADRIEIPSRALWVPASATGFGDRHDWWRVWEHPRPWSTVGEQRARLEAGLISEGVFLRLCALAIRPPDADPSGPPPDEAPIPPGQYIEAVDTAAGEEMTSQLGAWHAIQVIDHHTLEQVAEYRSRIDTDLLAEQALLAGLYFNEAWIAVETTGSYGTPVLKDGLHRRYGYARLYRRRRSEAPSDAPMNLLGWDTNKRTRQQMIIGLGEQLRERTDGIKSAGLAGEILTFVYGTDGKPGPEPGSFSDRLMAYMIAQQVGQEVRPRVVRQRTGGSGGAASYVRAPRNSRTGY